MDAARSLDNVAVALPASIYVFAIIAELPGSRVAIVPLNIGIFAVQK